MSSPDVPATLPPPAAEAHGWPVTLTPRCRLRPAQRDDFAALAAAVANPGFPQDLLVAQLHRKGKLLAWLEAHCRSTHATILWSITERASHLCIGQVALEPGTSPGEWWIFYWLAPEHWGKGLAREAVGGLLEHAFAQPQYAEINAAVSESNRRSCALLRALGFVQAQPVPGDFHVPEGHVLYRLVRGSRSGGA
jgi:ribosomal-protein-alanine N-acetyltransferase